MRRSIVCRAGVLFLIMTCVQFAMLQTAAASSGKIIYSFAGGADGAYPESDLIFDSAGNLYGTTSQGGYGCGTVYELIRGQSGWKHQVLYTFNGSPGDGCEPQAGLVFDSVGNLYGTTTGGGANLRCAIGFSGCGTVFKLAPNSQGTWSETVLYGFGNYTGDGYNPNTDLVFDSQGNLYGTTPYGGTSICSNKHIPGCGTVFKLTPQPDGTWVEDIIHEFAGAPSDGEQPITGVVFDDEGNIYGATYAGGGAACNTVQSYQGCGSIYRLMPSSGGGWKEKLLYIFHRYQGTAVYPSGGLIVDSDGGMLGVSNAGGNAFGAVFELQRTKNGWEQIVRYRFFGDPDGTFPVGRLARGTNGNFFGATTAGGPQTLGYGTVFELVPAKNRWNRWQERVLFNGDSTNGYPQAGPVVDSQGHVFGTFSDSRNSSAFGSVYEVIP